MASNGLTESEIDDVDLQRSVSDLHRVELCKRGVAQAFLETSVTIVGNLDSGIQLALVPMLVVFPSQNLTYTAMIRNTLKTIRVLIRHWRILVKRATTDHGPTASMQYDDYLRQRD